MCPRRDSSELATIWREAPPVGDELVDGRALDELVAAAAVAGVRELLTAATRGITRLLGDHGSCILLEGQPRVVVALDRPAISDLPFDLARYPEVRAAVEGRHLVAVDDVRSDAALAAVRERLPPGLRSVVAVPLVVGERCLGVVLVQSSRARHAAAAERATAGLIARVAALLLAERLRADPQDERDERDERDENALTPAPGAGASQPSPGAAAAPLDPAPSRILIVEDDDETAAALADTLLEEGYRVDHASNGVECLRQARETTPDLVLLDVGLPGMSGFDTAASLRRSTPTRGVPILFLSGLGDLPARVRDVRLEQVDFMPKPFSLDELRTRIQQALGQGRARQRLQLAAEQDELTGVGNLRLLHRRLANERARFSRYGHPLAVAMIDVDKLKTINDEHGHLAGSDALRGVAAVLRRQARDTDLVVRYGGDEFVALLPHTALADARIFGQRVRLEVAALGVATAGREEGVAGRGGPAVSPARLRDGLLGPPGVGVTVSVGVAALTRPGSGESSDDLLRRADRAAYRAKQAGGNRVCVDDQEPGGRAPFVESAVDQERPTVGDGPGGVTPE